MSGETRETVTEEFIPLIEEAASISKREVDAGQVRVALDTEVERVIARETLRGRTVTVERMAVDRTLAEDEEPPTIREEGDTLIIPVLEEVAVVVKRLVLREEVRLRFSETETPFEQELSVRRQKATAERIPPETQPSINTRE